MQKIIILTSLIILTILAACSPQPKNPSVNAIVYELPVANRLPDEYRSLLPEGAEVPTRLPSSVADSHLLTAWVYLYNQNDPITFYDGSTLTGRRLAEMVLEYSIPVVWGSDAICNGNSCSERFSCQDMACVASHNTYEIAPIYISSRFQDTQAFTLARLAGSLAHELYHYTRPFGPVDSSLFEEYWAFYVGAQIEHGTWAIFEGYNPNSAACLKAWFRVHGRSDYIGIAEYPLTLTTPVDTVSETCVP